MTEEEQIEAELIERELNKRNSSKRNNLFNKIGESVKSNPIGQAGLGFAQGLADVAPAIGNLAIKGSNYANKNNIPEFKGFHFAPDTLASKGGEIGAYLVGGGLLKAALNLPKIAKGGEVAIDLLNKFSKGSPHLEKIANALSSKTAKYMGGGAVVGALQSPENQKTGALLGAAIPGAFSAGKVIKNNAKPIYEKLTDMFSPAKHGNKLLEDLSHGAKDLVQADKMIAKDLRKGYEGRIAETEPYFSHAKNLAGEKNIYEAYNPLMKSGINKEESMINKLEKFKLGEIFDKFKSKPNFSNAHEIQTELGVRIGDLKSIAHKTPEQRSELNSLVSIREELKSDIKNMLKRHDEISNIPALPAYEKGIELHRKHVTPYLENKDIREVTRGGKEYIDDIYKAFEDIAGKKNKKTGEFSQSSIKKILEDMPSEIQEKLLFSRLGGRKLEDNPKELLKEIKLIKNEGKFYLKNLEDKFGVVSKAQKNKKIIKRGAFGAGSAIALESGRQKLIGDH